MMTQRINDDLACLILMYLVPRRIAPSKSLNIQLQLLLGPRPRRNVCVQTLQFLSLSRKQRNFEGGIPGSAFAPGTAAGAA